MTKKHFIALADMIKASFNFGGVLYTEDQINQLADFCASTNPRFNRERWIAYINGECGKNGGKVKRDVSDMPRREDGRFLCKR